MTWVLLGFRRSPILRASAGHTIKLMFPMIGSLAELRQARQVLAEVQAELRVEGIAFDEAMEVGVMIEVPSAVAIADQLAATADFFSIGSNDLTQYVMAADRGNGSVARLANALHPAVLRLIQQTVTAAHSAGIWVGLCGELAGNALAAPIADGSGPRINTFQIRARLKPLLPLVDASTQGRLA